MLIHTNSWLPAPVSERLCPDGGNKAGAQVQTLSLGARIESLVLYAGVETLDMSPSGGNGEQVAGKSCR